MPKEKGRHALQWVRGPLPRLSPDLPRLLWSLRQLCRRKFLVQPSWIRVMKGGKGGDEARGSTGRSVLRKIIFRLLIRVYRCIPRCGMAVRCPTPSRPLPHIPMLYGMSTRYCEYRSPDNGNQKERPNGPTLIGSTSMTECTRHIQRIYPHPELLDYNYLNAYQVDQRTGQTNA